MYISSSISIIALMKNIEHVPVIYGDSKFYNYVINKNGEVWSKLSNKYLKPQKREYLSVMLRLDGKTKVCLLHRLIARAFIPNPDNMPVVNHKNGDKFDNEIENLEWTTVKENNLHARITGLNKYFTRAVIQYDLRDNFIRRYDKISDAVSETGCNRTLIIAVCSGRRNKTGGFKWKYENCEKEQQKRLKLKRVSNIEQIDPETKIAIRTYNNILDVAVNNEYSYESIKYAIKFRKIFDGYFWIKKGDKIPLTKEDELKLKQAVFNGNVLPGYYVSKDGRVWCSSRQKFIGIHKKVYWNP